MTPTAINFLNMPLVSSTLEETRGNLFRIEIRKDPDTGRVLRGRFPIPSTRPGNHQSLEGTLP